MKESNARNAIYRMGLLAERIAARHSRRVWIYQYLDKPIDYGFDDCATGKLLAVVDPYEDEPACIEYLAPADLAVRIAMRVGVEAFAGI